MRLSSFGALAILLTGCGRAPSPAGGPSAEWPHYGNNLGGTRYSPLADITPQNVDGLKVAWTYHHGDIHAGSPEIPTRTGFEATPLVFDGTLYFPTPLNRVIALDPETGREKWAYDPKIQRRGLYGDGFICRGLAAWKQPGGTRLYMATVDARLIAINAATGQPDTGFGANGEVDLTSGIAIEQHGEYHMSSPPVVVGGTVVVGSAINDNQRVQMPSGAVRGYDARTGALRWSWNPVEGVNAGAGNAWGPLSGDEERGLVFIPTGSASPDFFGGERSGDDRHANSVVALEAATGKLVWAFQTVHHDVWDYDLAAQPVLFEFPLEGRNVPAVAQATKMGLLFVLHRETGQPLWPVEERPVPQGGVPGETLSPTQPFPALPPPLVPHRIAAADAWGLTPWDRARCREKIEGLRGDGIYTPPTEKGTLAVPGNAGGTNWGGVAVDPGRGLILVNQTNLPFEVRLVARHKAAADRKARPGMEFAPQAGTPFAMRRHPLLSPIGLPCVTPPWGTLAAVELSTGRIRWQKPLGSIRDLAPVPIPWTLGTPTLGGPVSTAGGVTFIGATLDAYLRAFDTATGEELWKGRLPAIAAATPVTYRARDGGRQYVVIAAGGHAKFEYLKQSDALVAFALP